MKLATLLGVTVLSLPFAGSALAAGPDMFAGVGAGGFSIDEDFDSASGSLVTAFGSVESNFTPTLGAQGDVVVQQLDLDFSGGGNETMVDADLALHGFYRDPSKFLFGGIAQFGHDSFSSSFFDDETRERQYVGVEAQGFFDKVTIYGQAGWLRSAYDDFDASASGGFVTGEVRFYPQPNVKLDLHAALSSLQANDPGDTTTTNVGIGVGAEYRFDGSPISIFAQLDETTSDADDLTATQQRIMVGIKGNMGADTLFDRDRNGASLKPVNPDIAIFEYGAPQ